MKNLIKKLISKPKLISFLTSLFFTTLLFSVTSRNFKYGTIMEMLDKGKSLEKTGQLTDEIISVSFNLGSQVTLLLISIIYIALIIIQAIYNNNNQKLFGIFLGILVFLILPSSFYMTIVYLILAGIFYILNELPEYKRIANFIMQLKNNKKEELKTYTIEIDRETLESKITTPDDHVPESQDTKEKLRNLFSSDYHDANDDNEVTKVHENLTQQVKELSKTEDILPKHLESPKRTRTKRFTVQNARIGDKLPLEFLNEHKHEHEYKKEFVTMDEAGTRYIREYKITWDEYGVIDDVKTTLTKR